MTINLSGRDMSTGASPLPYAGDQPTQVPVLRQYLGVLARRRWVVLGACVSLLLVGLVAAFLMTRQYSAVATIEISRESAQLTNFEGAERETSVADQEFYQTQYGLLRSRALAEKVANQLRLVDDPAFFERFDAPTDTPAFTINGGRYPAAGRADRQRVAGAILLENLSIEPTRLSRLVNISFTSPDPEFSARVANAWADNFIMTNLERKVQATSYGREQLQRQLAEYKERLDASQRQLVAYASQQEIINLPSSGGDANSSAERPIVADNLATLNQALSEATADRIQAEARARQFGRAGASSEALDNAAINGLRQRRAELSAEYEQLMVRFEPGYPAAEGLRSQIDALDRAIAREEGRVSSAIRADYEAARTREEGLRARVDGLKSEFLDLRRRSIQYNVYQQEVDTNRVLYDGLLQRFKEIGVAGGVGVNNISIVDPADVPQKPSSPNIPLILLLSLGTGLVIGVALAFGLEQLDDAISNPGELQRLTGLPLLGSVPVVADESPRDALLDRKSHLVDAYIAVQTNLAFTTEHGVPRSFAVTSTRPAEGKSTSALALATMLGRSGRRVILVDGDMRSPSVHHLGGVDHDRGLSNFLAGEDDIQTLTFPISDLGITAMSAGPLPPNAAELLTGNRLSLLIQRLLETFDHVIIDSPPVMGLADAPLIASRVEGIIYAVEADGTRSSMVKASLNRLAAANAHVFGAILTKFEPKRAQHGYAYEYGYTYGREQTGSAAAG